MNSTSHFGERKLFISITSRFLLVADERKKKFIRRAGAAVGGRPNRQILPLFLKRSQKFFGGRQSLPGLMSLLEHTFFVPGNKLLMQLVFCYMLLRFSHHFLPLKISSKLGPEVLVFLNRLRAANYFKKGVRALLLKNRHAIIKSRESRKRGLYHLRRLSNRLNKLHLRKPKFGYFALKKYYKKLSNLGEQLALVRSRLVNSGWSSKRLRGKNLHPPLNLFRRLVGQSLRRGNKKKVIKLLLNELCRLRRVLKIRRPTLFFLGVIIKKLNPFFVMRKHSVGRRTFTIPFPLVNKKKIATISRLFLRALTRRSEISFRRRLSEELKDIFIRGRRPASLKLRKDLLRTAFENKPNIRFLNVRRRNY